MKSRDHHAHGPFPSPVITRNTEKGGAGRTEEEGEGDGGCDGSFRNAVELCEGGDGQGNGVDWWKNREKGSVIEARTD